MDGASRVPTASRASGESWPPDPDTLLDLHRELWAAQRRQARAISGTRDRADADSAVAWFEWLLVDYLQGAAASRRARARPVKPGAA